MKTKQGIWKNGFTLIELLVVIAIIAILASSVLVLSCTDLEIEETDSVFSLDAGSEFTGVSDPAASLTSLAQSTSGMLGNQEAVYALQEVTTDAN